MHSSRITEARRLGVLLTAGTLSLTGCGLWQSEPASDTAAPPPPPLPTTSAPPPLPPRPFELGLDGVDPCELLTADQREQLGFDRDPLPDSEAGFGDAATCSYRNTTAKVGARLALITTEGMGVWTDDTAQVEASPVVIGGFPALVIKTPGLDLSCNVAVDVATGQHLDVLYRDDGGQPPPPVDQLCAGAQRVAEDALATLAAPETSSAETSQSSSEPQEQGTP
ncbi:DUF3558 domain-containing protein [Saccharopolyspora sp. 5N708]|uniref:DUF3558 domain-containing protein n=1 Tax=Saccharopolyspora sp. 5N708 TaxID=3457424 RepID=UPI003FD6A46A